MKRLQKAFRVLVFPVVLSLLFSSHALATPDPGPYFGGDMQFAYLNSLNKNLTNGRVLRLQSMSMQIDQGAVQAARNIRKGGVGIGFIFGYLLNENFAIENTYFMNKSALWVDNGYQRLNHRIHGFDLDGKESGILRIPCRVIFALVSPM